MIQVPNATAQFSLNVPGVQAPFTRDFGKPGAALEGAGQNLETGGMDVYSQIAHADATSTGTNAAMSDRVASSQKLIDLRNQAPDGLMRTDPNDPNSPYQRNQDGSPVTMTQAYRDWANDRYKSNQDAMPNALASETYKNLALGHFSGQIATLQDEVAAKRLSSVNENMENNVQALGNKYVTAPGENIMGTDPTTGQQQLIGKDIKPFYADADAIHAAYLSTTGPGNVMSVDQANQEARKSYQKMTQNLLEGAYNQVHDLKKVGDPARVQDIQAWRNILAGTDPDSVRRANMKDKNGNAAPLPTISSMMDPAQKAAADLRLQDMQPGAKAADLSDYRGHLEDTYAALTSGDGKDHSAALNAMLQQTSQYKQQGALHDVESAQIVGKLYAADSIGKMTGTGFDALPPAKQQERMDSAVSAAMARSNQFAAQNGVKDITGELGRAASTEISNFAEKRMEQIKTEKETQFPEFIQRIYGGSPDGQAVKRLDVTRPISWSTPENIAAIQSLQRRGLTLAKTSSDNNSTANYTGILRKDQVDGLANTLQSVPNASTGANYVRALNRASPALIGQAVDSGSLPYGWKIAQMNPNLSSMASLVTALNAPGQINKTYEFNTKGEPPGEMETAVHNQMGDLITSVLQSAPGNIDARKAAASMTETVTTYAKDLYNQHPASGTTDDVAKAAVNQLMGPDVIHSFKTGAPTKFLGMHFGGTTEAGIASVPMNFGGRQLQPSDIGALHYNSSQQMLPENLAKLQAVIPKTASGDASKSADNFLQYVSQHGHVTVQTGPEPGYHVYYWDQTGKSVPLNQADNSGNAIMKTQSNGVKTPVPVFIPRDRLLEPIPAAPPSTISKAVNKGLNSLSNPQTWQPGAMGR